MKSQSLCTVSWIIFDFGGVIAEEGFRNGLKTLAAQNKIDMEFVAQKGKENVYTTGYLLGKCTEERFWDSMRRDTGIQGSDQEFQKAILQEFIIRSWMLDLVEKLNHRGVDLAILSDQVNWLDMLNEMYSFFPLFDRVFNSYHLGRSKRDPETFTYICQELETAPEKVLFIDDSAGHVQRAKDRGLETIHYQGKEQFLKELSLYCPELKFP